MKLSLLVLFLTFLSGMTSSLRAFEITSRAFGNNEAIPATYTCDGQDLSPPLSWASVPKGTTFFVLIFDDPDAPKGTWDHWVVYNIPAKRTHFPRGFGKKGKIKLPGKIEQGVNSWSKNNQCYRGPCPPRGHGPHRYFFTIYALDVALNFSDKDVVTKQIVLERMKGHVVKSAKLVGTYERK